MFELAVVMPVYNEEACISAVITSWLDTLSALGISFRMIVLNDGSRDHTLDVLQTFQGHEQLIIVDKANSGHGPTILEGYRRAVDIADWVFQCDSDNEMGAKFFSELWERREGYDALFGYRAGRRQHPGRKLISACSRLTVKLLFGTGVVDVNTPYRLMRAPLLGTILPQIPTNTFAPNVIIAGTFAKANARIYNHPIPHAHRQTGQVSIIKWRLLRAAFRSFLQTVQCRPTLTIMTPPVKDRADADR